MAYATKAQRDGKKYPNGNALKIEHTGGLATAYLHLDTKAVGKGVTVRRGQRIGTAGSTGASTGPHLHFMVYQGGKTVDPWPLLTGINAAAPLAGALGHAPTPLPFLT